MPDLTYLHKVFNQSLKDGVVTTYEEQIIDGPKGVTIKFYSKDGKSEEKIQIMSKGDKFLMLTKDGEKKDEKTLSKDELLDELKKNKKLKFASDFAKTKKGETLLERSKRASSTKNVKKTKTKSKSKSASRSSQKPKKVKKVKK
jgi:hypothetical protein